MKILPVCGVFVLASCLLIEAAIAAGPLTLFVAPGGNDAWSGRVAAANADGVDGPLATLQGAREAIRRAKSQGHAGPITVRIAGGMYHLNEPFVLEPGDSGRADAPIVYEAAEGEQPVISGGRVITGFVVKGDVWEAKIPQVAAGSWYFRQLFINGQRRMRARGPNEGYYRIAQLLPGPHDERAQRATDRQKFKFTPGDLKPWQRLGDVNLILMHSWETSIHPLAAVDEATHTVTLAAPMREWWTIGWWEPHARYYVENARELLDAPGEWYLDRATGVLTYKPMPGETIESATVIAPVVTELLVLKGDPDAGRLIEHVTFRGLRFHHADWALSPQGNSSTQAAVEVPAAIMADGVRHVAFEKCEIAHVGGYGLWLRRGCKENLVQQCRLFDLGAGGVRIGEAVMPPSDETESSSNVVDNNHIHDGGHVYAAGVGVWIAQSSGNRVSHNEIHDLFYSGMSIGWNWNDAPNRTHHNTIAFNHIHHVLKGVLSDGGAIYALGVSTGSVIRNNICHDIWPYEAPALGWGIYLDGTCSGYLVENNIVYNTRSGGLMYNNGGHGHTVRNNIFALSADYALWPHWDSHPTSFTQNIVYLTQGRLLVPHADRSLQLRRSAGESLGEWDRNVYWHTQQKENLRFSRSARDIDARRELGVDKQSVIADPLFVNVAAYDFRLQPGSPALKLGFEPIDTSRVGLYGDAAWVAEARAVRHAPTVLPPAAAGMVAREFADDFEATAPGAAPADAHADAPQNGASIAVTEEHAAGGRRSLKLTDSSTLEPTWMPHLYYQPHLVAGSVRHSFDLRLGAGAHLIVEWRDETEYPRCIGPSVTFEPGGRVVVAGKEVARVPIDQWVHVQIDGTLGRGTSRTFSLTITGPAGLAARVDNLPIGGEQFEELHWVGFVAAAKSDVALFIDNVEIRRR